MQIGVATKNLPLQTLKLFLEGIDCLGPAAHCPTCKLIGQLEHQKEIHSIADQTIEKRSRAQPLSH